MVFAPVLGVLLFVLANNKRPMGDMRNRPWQNVLGALGLIAILGACYRLLSLLLGS